MVHWVLASADTHSLCSTGGKKPVWHGCMLVTFIRSLTKDQEPFVNPAWRLWAEIAAEFKPHVCLNSNITRTYSQAKYDLASLCHD